MSPSKSEGVDSPAAADFHVHLRAGPMTETVAPTIRQGGVDMVYVMVSHWYGSRRTFAVDKLSVAEVVLSWPVVIFSRILCLQSHHDAVQLFYMLANLCMLGIQKILA